MSYSSQPSSCNFFNLHSHPPLNLANLQTHNQKPLLFAGAFHILFKFRPHHFLRLQAKCTINGSLLSKPPKGIIKPDEESFISSTDYLIGSLGLPPESAAGFTKLVRLKSTANADSVLALFRSYGFTSSDLAQIFSAFPKLLLANPNKTLKPKLDFFVENRISGETLFRVLAADPHILRISLRRRIAPCFEFLREFYGNDDGAVAEQMRLRRGTWVLRNFSETTVTNVATLLSYGVPKPNIVKMFATVPSFSRPADQFMETVREVKAMGFDPSRTTFTRALNAFLAISKEKREAKMEVFKSYGFTDDQIRCLLVKQPQYLIASEEKLKDSLEFCITKLHWSIVDVTKYFTLLTCSIKKRISPRISVLEILHSRGLVKKTTFCSACHVSEAVFLARFVMKHKERIPHLLEVYKKNMSS